MRSGRNIIVAESAQSFAHTASQARAASSVVIRPAKGALSLDLRDLWEYRELLYFLVWRDIKVRYKQSVLGAGWAIVQPFTTMIVFTVIFGGLARIPSDGVPYPIFAYTALLPWQYFAASLGRSSSSVVGSSALISKVYFPRLIVPLAATFAPLVDFAIAFVVLAGMMLYFGIVPTWGLAALPLFLLLAFATALAVGLWLSALNVRYRDVGHLVPFLLNLWMYASPVAYPSSLVPEHWRALYGLNPLAGVIEGFRWAVLGRGSAPDATVFVSTVVVLVLLVGGLVYFQRTQETFVDVI